MNIFALSDDPKEAAQMHCDKHVVKMVLESAQMLSTVHHQYKSNMRSFVYKPTHANHPCTMWAGENQANYHWLFEHFNHLADEYTHRYSRYHKTWEKLRKVLDVRPAGMPWAREHTPFARAMPDAYKWLDDPIDSYRLYYAVEKADILKYTNRERPKWLSDLQLGLETIEKLK